MKELIPSKAGGLLQTLHADIQTPAPYSEDVLLLETVIWTEPYTDNFLACSEVRASIMEKFKEYGITIPYNYLNVLLEDREEYDGRKKRKLQNDDSKDSRSRLNTVTTSLPPTEKKCARWKGPHWKPLKMKLTPNGEARCPTVTPSRIIQIYGWKPCLQNPSSRRS